MTKNLIVRFRVEDVDLPDLLKSLFLLSGGISESDDSLAVIEDFYVPMNLIISSEHVPTNYDFIDRDPKSGWPNTYVPNKE